MKILKFTRGEFNAVVFDAVLCGICLGVILATAPAAISKLYFGPECP